jgi:transcriptional regulator of acetoin/glycerol metabolism
VALADGALLTPEHFPSLTALPAPAAAPEALPALSLTADQAQERGQLLSQLAAHRWNVSHVAKLLGVSRNTLYRRMHKLCIPVSQTSQTHG